MFRRRLWSLALAKPNCRHVRVDPRISKSKRTKDLVIAPLHVWHDERANRAVITSAPETHMALAVLTWLHLFTLEKVAGRDIEPAGTCLHQLVASDREAIHIAAAGKRIPRMRQRRDGGNQRCDNRYCQSHQKNSLSVSYRCPQAKYLA